MELIINFRREANILDKLLSLIWVKKQGSRGCFNETHIHEVVKKNRPIQLSNFL
jgi:hypothetical protein